LEADTDRTRFLPALGAEPAAVDAVHLTGPHDYELTVRCADTDEFDRLAGPTGRRDDDAAGRRRPCLMRVAVLCAGFSHSRRRIGRPQPATCE